MNDLKSLWKEGKDNQGKSDIQDIIKKAEARKRSAVLAQYGTIIVLSVTWVMIVACFFNFFPFKTWLARTGVWLMAGGLALRILIEAFSIVRARKVSVADAALDATGKWVDYYSFRKRIHGPITYVIVALYIIGFYLLTPEFLQYVAWQVVLPFDLLFAVGTPVMIYFVRKGIRKEMSDLDEVVELSKKISR